MTTPKTASAAADAVVRIERVIAAPPERVFDAWLDPVLVARWLSPTGRAEAETDPRVGGTFRVVMLGDGIRLEHSGTYLELEPGRRLTFTWRSPFTGPNPTQVTIDLAPERDGAATHLTLTHLRLPAVEVANHRGGWGSILDRLAGVLEGA